jgi:hypothetical protein
MDVLLHTLTPGARASKSIVGALQRLHIRTRECGVRDFEIGALLHGLASIEKWDDARDIHDTYMRQFRRSRLPVHSVLRRASALISATTLDAGR